MLGAEPLQRANNEKLIVSLTLLPSREKADLGCLQRIQIQRVDAADWRDGNIGFHVKGEEINDCLMIEVAGNDVHGC
ncbi:MAG: hypothetical protein Rhims3KO_15350 [Hyphomicrobiales bacterium]